MINNKKTSIFPVIIFLYLSFVFLISGRSLLAQELTPSIVSFMPDFYQFWEKAKDEPLEKKVSLWDSLFETKHSEFYQATVYASSGQDPEQVKARMLKGFLDSLEDTDIQRMKDSEGLVKELIPQALKDLSKILPAEKGVTTHYIIPSLNMTSGSARPYKGDMVVYYGLEILSRFKNPADIKAVIAHETFHVLHFRHIFPYYREKFGENVSIMSALQGEGLLFFSFMEGLAVYSTEKLYPGIFRPGLIEKNVPLYEENFVTYTREFLKDLQNFSYKVYQRYFIDPSQDPVIPAKFGYWLGYAIVKSLVKEHSIQEMMAWTPDVAIKIMKEEIDKILE